MNARIPHRFSHSDSLLSLCTASSLHETGIEIGFQAENKSQNNFSQVLSFFAARKTPF